MNIQSAVSQNNSDQHTVPNKRVGRKVTFLVGVVAFVIIAIVFGDVLRQKWSYEKDSAAQQIVHGYYKEKPHSIDVLCLGASTIRNGVSALELFEDYGFTTYSRATSIQLPFVSYYLLLEALETQDIKAVVIDATTISNVMLNQVGDTMSGKLHEAIDYMPWSKYKVELIREAVKLNDKTSFLSYALPLYAYHDRWSEISEYDFTYRSWMNDYCYKGQYPTTKTVRYTFPADYMAGDESSLEQEDFFYLEEDARAYFKKMIEVCKERGIEFVMIKTPVRNWTVYRHNVIARFAQENSVSFIDYNEPAVLEKIGFDATKDFADMGYHPNISGAKKISVHLGEYLSNTCQFTDKRTDSDYFSWNEDCKKYDALLLNHSLSQESNLIGFLEKIDNPDYITLVATAYDTSKKYNESVDKAFKKLGVEAPFAKNLCLSYLAIIDAGSVVYQQADENPLDHENLVEYSTDYQGHSIFISSLSSPLTDNKSIIELDGVDYSTNGVGFNFVVFDKKTATIAAAKSFNTSITGTDYVQPNPFAGLSKDPLAYFELLNNEDYITIMAAAKDGSRYVPGIVNDKLSEMGLLPIDGQFDQPYIGILNGSKIVYNEYGAPDTELSTKHEIEGVPVTVISDAASGNAKIYLSVGEAKSETNQNPGLILYVYSKSEQRTISYIRFNWSNNYYSSSKVNGIDNIQQLLTECRKNGYDVFCLYNAKEHEFPAADCVAALNDYGFARLVNGTSYAGVVRADGSVDDLAGYNDVELSPKMAGLEVSLTVGETDCEAEFNGVVYSTKGNGLHIFVYDGETRSVLAEILYASKSDKAPNPFTGCSNDPVRFLELTDNDDYITAIVASKDGSRYMPGIVNDKLSEMGLIPLDGELDRPYIGILDGSKIVYNEYGDPNTELSTTCEIDGVPVKATSRTSPDNVNVYISVGNGKAITIAFKDPSNNKYSGLIMYVYSKSKQKLVGYNRFQWTND